MFMAKSFPYLPDVQVGAEAAPHPKRVDHRTV